MFAYLERFLVAFIFAALGLWQEITSENGCPSPKGALGEYRIGIAHLRPWFTFVGMEVRAMHYSSSSG